MNCIKWIKMSPECCSGALFDRIFKLKNWSSAAQLFTSGRFSALRMKSNSSHLNKFKYLYLKNYESRKNYTSG